MKYARQMRNKEIFFRALCFFTIELVMISFIIVYYLKNGVDFAADYGTVVLKFCCAIAIHLMQQPTIENTLQRMKYILQHPDDFEQTLVPLLVTWMKFWVEFLIEVAMIVSTAYENYNTFMIMDFSALTVINYIDFYYTSLLKDDLKVSIEMVEESVRIKNTTIKDEQLTWYERVAKWLLIALTWVYETIYYHFWPYGALLYSIYIIRGRGEV